MLSLNSWRFPFSYIFKLGFYQETTIAKGFNDYTKKIAEKADA